MTREEARDNVGTTAALADGTTITIRFVRGPWVYYNDADGQEQRVRHDEVA